MTDTHTPTEPVATAEPVLAHGHVLLSQARQAAGLPLDALSLALKVPVKRLESLEAGRYDELPDLTFARALAMSVCRHLQIDSQMVLDRMPSAHAPSLGATGVVGGDSMYATEEGLALSPVKFYRRPPFLMALALVLAAALLYSLPEAPESPATPEPAAASPVVEPPAPAPVPPLDPAANVSATSTPATTNTTAPQPVTEAKPMLTDASAAPTRSVVLRVSAQNETWLEVIRPDGTVLLSRLLKAGDVVDMGTAPPYTVVLGRANAAQVFVRGQAIPLAPHTRGDVVRYEVK
jgi:cytoskeleton protein RodZ